ncbi:MAG: hypothetical protein K5640_03990, partial [Treponema sp.]|nr:hypothetical protein [Treponema sp.]
MEDEIKKLLNEGLEKETLHCGYEGKIYTLFDLRNVDKYKADDPNIGTTKEKYKKIYNCLKDIVPPNLLREVYGIEGNFVENWLPVKINTKLPYCVSNLGRIAIDLGNSKRKILLQEDMKDTKTGQLKKGYLAISY